MEQKSTSRYILTALAIIVVVTALALVALNAFDLENRLGWNMLRINSGGQALADKYREGYLNARAAYAQICPMVNRQGSTITGKIISLNKDTITIQQDYFDTDPLIDKVEQNRVASINKNTVFVLSTQKTAEQLARETSDFKPGTGTPPSPAVAREITFSSLKAGDRVTIESDRDLRTAAVFTAVKVTVNK